MEVVLYSSGCPKCQVLESKLMAKGIPFKITNNFSMGNMVNLFSTHPSLEKRIAAIERMEK